MKTVKFVSVVVAVFVLLTLCAVPSTFSWYTHNENAEGVKLTYIGDDPISIKSAANTLSMTTYEADANGVVSGSAVDTINLPADAETKKAIKYYKTTFTNTGANDVFVDFYTKSMPNNADFVVGTVSPTLNEKAYASRAARTKVTSNTVRVYFKTYHDMSSYWSVDNGRLIPETGTYNPDGTQPETTADAGSAAQKNDSTGTSNDINISYTANGKEVQVKMLKCTTNGEQNGTMTVDTITSDSGTNKVYYYDIPSNTEKFYFFNHWYLRSNTSREWNRTIDITDLTAGRLYYLNGNKVDDKYKAYSVRDVDSDLVAVSSYYTSVRLSMGTSVYADIGLKKTSDDVDFVPEYYGSSISYTSSEPTVASVNKDGLITPKSQGTATITTKITGRYGDYKTVTTDVNIPANIDQIPIITNVKVAKAGAVDNKGAALDKVEVLWYAINKSDSAIMTTTSLFCNI